MKIPELMAPAGSWACMSAAIDAGADSVYFGLKQLNMRATADNFELSELRKIARLCHSKDVRAYLAINIIIYEKELSLLGKTLKAAKKAGIDAVICWDLAVIEGCRALGIPFIVSTQASVSNSASAEYYRRMGAKRVVLARECTIGQIREIREKTGVELEAFIHGAMCVSVSGRCFMSQFLFCKSANRGECLQPCRREYRITDAEEGHELTMENSYVMSAKDLCAMPFLDKVLETGVDSLKIEGRTKSAEYVKVTTECYREALDAWKRGKLTRKLRNVLYEKLKTVYNRGFSDGFYMGRPSEKDFARQYGSAASKVKLYSGRIVNFYRKVGVANIKIEDNTIRKGDEIAVIGPTTGCIIQKAQSMEISGRQVDEAQKGRNVGIMLKEPARENDRVYVLRKTDVV